MTIGAEMPPEIDPQTAAQPKKPPPDSSWLEYTGSPLEGGGARRGEGEQMERQRGGGSKRCVGGDERRSARWMDEGRN